MLGLSAVRIRVYLAGTACRAPTKRRSERRPPPSASLGTSSGDRYKGKSDTMPDIKAIQAELRASKIDGWLFYDHHRRDPIANHILEIGKDQMATRRWFYFIPARGEPRKLVHRIEQGMLDSLPGSKQAYSSWEELHKGLRKLLSGCAKIAMQYSPENNIPYIGLVDAGTVELVRKLKKKVVTSANLVQKFEATWTPEQLESHLEAGRAIDRI